jgi:hypothetical protein
MGFVGLVLSKKFPTHGPALGRLGLFQGDIGKLDLGDMKTASI